MKRLLYLFLFLYGGMPAFAQNLEFGTGASFTKFSGKIYNKDHKQFVPITTPVKLTFNVIVSGNIPLKYLKDEVVFGVNPTAGLSLFYSTIALDVPVLATLKLGAGSSDKTDAALGTGIGIGGQFSFFSTYLNADAAPVSYSGAMFLPVIMGETSIIFRGYNMYQIRVEITPVPVRRINKNFVGEISQINIRLLRAFL